MDLSVSVIPPSTTFISLGYRCSAAAILKRLQFKTESYPFDWLISRLSVIKDCISNQFQEFLNINNYERRYSNTYKRMDTTHGFICDEHLMVNTHYQPAENSHPENTYQYYLAMNHHNILLKGDYEYYERCCQRFKQIMISPSSIVFVNIQPLIPFEMYHSQETKDNILYEIQSFDNFLYDTHCQCALGEGSITGLYFIMVQLESHHHKGEFEYTNEIIQYECMKNTKSRIHIIYVNADFIDAGETFMGNCHNEREYIENIIRSYQTSSNNM
jgi:hypothetical protein